MASPGIIMVAYAAPSPWDLSIPYRMAFWLSVAFAGITLAITYFQYKKKKNKWFLVAALAAIVVFAILLAGPIADIVAQTIYGQ